MLQFQPQVLMRRVLYALAPIYLASVYFYGWRILLLSAVVYPLAIFAEWVLERIKNKEKAKVSEAVLVTATLYIMAMPPAIANPGNLWIAALGILFGVIFGKEVFGGFGRNVVNPAIAGRLFVFLTFPQAMGTLWIAPGHYFGIQPGGTVDAIASATALDLLRAQQNVDWVNLFFGFRPGSLGEGPIFLIILAGLFLVFSRVKVGANSLPIANWRLMVSTMVSAYAVMALVWYFFPDYPKKIDPLLGMLSGSLMFCAVFMCTDPVTAPKKNISMIAYGIIAGSVTALIRLFGSYPEGSSFGILVANVFASLLDETIGKLEKPKKAPAKAPQPQGAQG